MNADKLKEILEKHLHWIREDCDGWEAMRADLYRANLAEADLSGANLYRANLAEANLSRANLYRANMYGADLSGADLYRADLSRADLSGADLYRANLAEANLSRANLAGANLHGANLDRKLIDRFYPICCPEYGAFIAWKKANGYIVKLQIPEDAKRGSAFGRKCRASKTTCLAIETVDGGNAELPEVASGYDNSFIYRVGETVEVEDFDEDRTHECAPGIHFFITRQEAVDYN